MVPGGGSLKVVQTDMGVGQCGAKPGTYLPGQVGSADRGDLCRKLGSRTLWPRSSEISGLASELWAWLPVSGRAAYMISGELLTTSEPESLTLI